MKDLFQRALDALPNASTHTINTQTRRLQTKRISLSLSDINLFSLLRAQSQTPLGFWKEKDSNESYVFVGAHFYLESLPSFETQDSHLPPIFFGAFSFDQKKSKAFPKSCFFLPQIEIFQNEEETIISLNLISSDAKLEIEQILKNFEFNEKTAKLSNPIQKIETPSQSQWDKMARHALDIILATPLEKVVLARELLYEFEEDVCGFSIIEKLSGTASNSTLFALKFSEDSTFIGATPEILFQRNKNVLKTVALAGTTPRGKNPTDDKYLRNRLRNDPKELHEFDFVKRDILSKIKHLCEASTLQNANSILQTSHVQHLFFEVWGNLKKTTSDQSILELIHPTPAMCGTPTDLAKKLIKKIETFDRGFYAAPIGILTPKKASFYVGIRSALIEKKHLRLFAGCGIVKGSTPENEWIETENKMRQFEICIQNTKQATSATANASLMN